MKYDPRTRYYPAFDDGELYVDLGEEFTDSERAKSFVKALNTKERKRLGDREPDTLWFVIKAVQKLTIEWSDRAPKKRVVRKKATTE